MDEVDRFHSYPHVLDHQTGFFHLRELSFLPPTRFSIFLPPEMSYHQTPSSQLNCSSPGAEQILDGKKTKGREGRGLVTLVMWKSRRKNHWEKILPESIMLYCGCFSSIFQISVSWEGAWGFSFLLTNWVYCAWACETFVRLGNVNTPSQRFSYSSKSLLIPQDSSTGSQKRKQTENKRPLSLVKSQVPLAFWS